MEFEIPTWNSNWDFEESTVQFTVKLTVRFTMWCTNLIIYNTTPKFLIKETRKTKSRKKKKQK